VQRERTRLVPSLEPVMVPSPMQDHEAQPLPR
jgi:hypothetical protein